MTSDQRAELARRYLAEVSAAGVEQLPPTVLMREVAELRRLLGQVLGILAAFDWEHSDRQYALEAIERIVTGGEQ